ncbi:hypothetical protein [Nonomuraea sp. NBC_00507]|uniref:hypothetical protein n=1 Tax=Nonomuraea sp. NBC_00507 TaxID=2976002 RepID=UPI002E176247
MSGVLTAAGDLRRVVVRGLRREVRVLDGLIVNIALPVVIMVLFVYVFGGAITTGSSGLAYIDFVVPAVLLMSGGYGAALTAVNVAGDMTGGMIDRFRTLPIGGWVVPAGTWSPPWSAMWRPAASRWSRPSPSVSARTPRSPGGLWCWGWWRRTCWRCRRWRCSGGCW